MGGGGKIAAAALMMRFGAGKSCRSSIFGAGIQMSCFSDFALADVAIAEPLNDTVEVAGPEPIRMDELVRHFLSANGDPRKVITDVRALYYGIEVNDQSLVPGDNPRLGPTRFEDWLSQSIPQR